MARAATTCPAIRCGSVSQLKSEYQRVEQELNRLLTGVQA
jgi:hypothetical protein